MDKERVWIKDEDGNIYYCEIKSINIDVHYGIVEYEVYPIIGCFTGFTTLLDRILSSPTTCIIWINDNIRPFGVACYDLNKLINDGK